VAASSTGTSSTTDADVVSGASVDIGAAVVGAVGVVDVGSSVTVGASEDDATTAVAAPAPPRITTALTAAIPTCARMTLTTFKTTLLSVADRSQ
jgi:hypothetical protein